MKKQKYIPKPATQSIYDQGRKLTTVRGKPVSRFVMHCKFYDHAVDEDTGEVYPKEWYYKGDKRKLELANKNRLYNMDELSALFYTLYWIQHKCYQVIFYDNNLPYPGNIICEIKEGKFYHYQFPDSKQAATFYRKVLEPYNIIVKRFIPHYAIRSHIKTETA